ncbi:MAG: hypothetical protein FWB78_04855 [Treponema sp.]|nr:hypothetical protein [Treponema sp.]
MKNTFKFLAAAIIAAIGLSMMGCPLDNTDTADAGTFRVRITDIPLAYFNAANSPASRFEIGLFPARQAPLMTYFIAGSNMWGSNDIASPVLGTGMIEFDFYDLATVRPFVGRAGNFDIGIQMSGPSNTLHIRVIINVRLEVNRVNTISFTAFGRVYRQ